MDESVWPEISKSLERIALSLEELVGIEKERERLEKKDRGVGGLEE